ELFDLLGDELAVAAVNAPDQCVVSGPVGAVERFEQVLATRDVQPRRLHISAAAHSTLVDPVRSNFRDAVATLRPSPPTLMMISDHTGGGLTAAEAGEPSYGADTLRRR